MSNKSKGIAMTVKLDETTTEATTPFFLCVSSPRLKDGTRKTHCSVRDDVGPIVRRE